MVFLFAVSIPHSCYCWTACETSLSTLLNDFNLVLINLLTDQFYIVFVPNFMRLSFNVICIRIYSLTFLKESTLKCPIQKRNIDNAAKNDMRNSSYSGGQPVKCVMEYALQQEYTRTKHRLARHPFFSCQVVRCVEGKKNIYKTFTPRTMSSLWNH